jgi:5-methyltetrahydrofolate--homocysteine methyltransferase
VLVIGERINSSIKKIEQAILSKDAEFIKAEAMAQLKAGAHVIDINAGSILKTEQGDLIWLLTTIFEVIGSEARIAFDSANPEILASALGRFKELYSRTPPPGKPIINSVTADDAKLESVLPLVKKFDAQLVGLCMDKGGIPDEPEKRCELGEVILNTAKDHQISAENLFLDPLVLPVSTDTQKGLQALETIKLLKDLDPDVNTVVGLSNISYGLPMKALLNRTFLVMAMAAGLDAAILNPLDKRLMNFITAAEVILGRDDFCMKYIAAYRQGLLLE